LRLHYNRLQTFTERTTFKFYLVNFIPT
jgi:hypothetical protein